MRDVYRDANVGKMEPIAQPDERYRYDVVRHKLFKVLAPLLLAQDHDHGLLYPVRRLEQVVELEGAVEGPVRIRLVHAARVKVPHGRARHYVQAQRSREGEVDGRVGLFHEAQLLAARGDAATPR